MTASVDELRALPWNQLIGESKASSCEHIHSALMKWFRSGTLPPDQAARWHEVEPVLGLFIEMDPDAERPFSPAALLGSIPMDLLRNLAGIAVSRSVEGLVAAIQKHMRGNMAKEVGAFIAAKAGTARRVGRRGRPAASGRKGTAWADA